MEQSADAVGDCAVAVAIVAVAVQVGNLGLHTWSAWRVARDPSLLSVLLANGLLVSAAIGVALATIMWLGTQLLLGVNVLLNLWLVPANGIVGAAMSSNVAYGLMLIISGLYFRRLAPQ